MFTAIFLALYSPIVSPSGQLEMQQLSCDRGTAALESAALSWRLSEKDLGVLLAVARDRSQRGLEILPNWLDCPDIARASLDVSSDARSIAILHNAGRSAQDYLIMSWALTIALYAEDFGLSSDPRIQHNVRFVAKHRARIERALSRD